ncbi:hypothetical protein [Streptomyces sp. SAJ15]|uniref:hypothetical protein n=1 Tax=Streptomyces sp. SAJ15 TaxID=2011095 RepID=UPI0021B3CCB7|nr:hypothetical protein [Streptomyces sp. SAJ15]
MFQNIFSRSETSSRHRAAICFSARALVRSGGAGRRSMPIVGSPSIQPWRCHQPIALRAMDSSRLTVSASISSASSASASGRAGSSIAATGKAGGFAPRRSGPVGAGSPASIHPHVVSEIR